MGPSSAPAVPALIDGLDDDETGPVAAEALAKIGQASVPALIQTLDHPDRDIKGLAAYTLQLINTPGTRGVIKTAERSQHVAPFQPLVEHFLPQVQVVYDETKLNLDFPDRPKW